MKRLFLEGLEAELQDSVAKAMPASLDDAIKYAEIHDRIIQRRLTETPAKAVEPEEDIKTVIEKAVKEALKESTVSAAQPLAASSDRSFDSNRGSSRNFRGRGRGRWQPQRPQCHYCRRYGHTERDCWTKRRQQNQHRRGSSVFNNNNYNTNNNNSYRSNSSRNTYNYGNYAQHEDREIQDFPEEEADTQ